MTPTRPRAEPRVPASTLPAPARGLAWRQPSVRHTNTDGVSGVCFALQSVQTQRPVVALVPRNFLGTSGASRRAFSTSRRRGFRGCLGEPGGGAAQALSRLARSALGPLCCLRQQKSPLNSKKNEKILGTVGAHEKFRFHFFFFSDFIFGNKARQGGGAKGRSEGGKRPTPPSGPRRVP